MKVLGIFESRWRYWAICLLENEAYLIKLGFGSSITEFFIDYVTILEKQDIETIKEKNTLIKIDEQNLKIELKKNKYWKHKIMIHQKSQVYSFSIIDRDKIDLITNALKQTFSDKLIIIE